MKSNAIIQLEIDLFNDLAATHPHFPVKYIPKQRRSDATANGLTRCIIEYIRQHGGQAERISITGRPNQIGGRIMWTKSHMTRGTADISATIGGRSVKIEVKVGRDRQSSEQRNYQREVEQAGGIYYIARNFESFVKWYESLWRQ